MFLELVAQRGHEQLKPEAVQLGELVLTAEHNVDGAAATVARVLPHGFDARLEDVVVQLG